MHGKRDICHDPSLKASDILFERQNQSTWHNSHLVLAVVLTVGSFLGI